MSRISARYLGKRIVVSYLTILVIMTVIFALTRAQPGSFVTSMVSPGMNAETIERLREQWGLNEPLWRQYIDFMINYQTGNFGRSPNWGVPVWDLFVRRMPRTLILFGAVFIVGYTVGPLIGMYLGWWRGSKKDQSIFVGGLLAYSMPAFWIAWLFLWLFDYQLGWFPSTYMLSPFAQYEPTAVNIMIDVLHHIALPLFSVVFIGWVGSMLIMRPTMNNVVDEDYVFLAQAKGLSERTVMIKHAARNALIPVTTGAIIALAFLIDGSIIIENVFSWPGMGQVIVTAVLNNDYPVTQGAFFLLGVLVVVMRLLTDVVYTYLDPRIKFGENE
jgi:peptide/nickel transport system permease protein